MTKWVLFFFFNFLVLLMFCVFLKTKQKEQTFSEFKANFPKGIVKDTILKLQQEPDVWKLDVPRSESGKERFPWDGPVSFYLYLLLYHPHISVTENVIDYVIDLLQWLQDN